MTTNIGILALITFNIFLAISMAVLWVRLLRPPKEDPRLSRGLQLLQSKIAVLEDLSDRTEKQVGQLIQILDERAKFLRTKILQAEETMLKVEQSMAKSLDVAKIFQDKIPHEEIRNRQQTSKYVQAAQLAHLGKTAEEIAKAVDLPMSEVELIAKVNREELTFDPELLPEWAKTAEDDLAQASFSNTNKYNSNTDTRFINSVFHDSKMPDLTNLKKTEDHFKRAVQAQEDIERREFERRQAMDQAADQLKQTASHMAQQFVQTAESVTRSAMKGATQMTKSATQVTRSAIQNAQPIIRKVQFPKITIDK